MKFNVEINKISQSSECMLKLDDLPLTEKFGKFNKNFEKYDQELHICNKSGHVFLKNILSPDILYSKEEYKYNTSGSPLSMRSLNNFNQFCSRFIDINKRSTVLDIGGNDLHLMKLWKNFNSKSECFVIDPVCEDIDGQIIDEINVIGKFIEKVNLSDINPDIVVCRHTLEHIVDPALVLNQIIENTRPNTTYIFEVPCYESMIEGMRLDVVFHQHLNYFSVDTFTNLIIENGGEVLGYEINHQGSCGGALMIAFKKNTGQKEKIKFINIDDKVKQFKNVIKNHKLSMEILKDNFINIEGKKFGYGAGLMLSTFAYHSKIDFSDLDCIIDDDKNKNNLEYENVPVKVKHLSKANPPKNSVFLITSLENIRPIYNKINNLEPRRILLPIVA